MINQNYVFLIIIIIVIINYNYMWVVCEVWVWVACVWGVGRVCVGVGRVCVGVGCVCVVGWLSVWVGGKSEKTAMFWLETRLKVQRLA